MIAMSSSYHHLQKSLYHGFYTADFNKTFTKMILLGLKRNASYQLTLKVQVKVTVHKEYYLSYYQTDLNQIFFKDDDADSGIVTFMCAGPYFFTTDNCLLYMDAPTNQPFICGLPL